LINILNKNIYNYYIMNNNYYRLILTSSGQSIYGSPVYNNLNFPNLEPYRFCKIFVESCGVSVNEDVGGGEASNTFITIELQDFNSSNTQICNGSNTSNSSILDVIDGVVVSHTGEGHSIIKCNKMRTADIKDHGAVFPINVLQNSSISLNIRYADNTIIASPPAPHDDYKIILGIQLLE